ncbi:MAG: hypothetical protein M9958_04515 [Chitinophagales bacterium]|nr:hypothetical protein [Chitinophagales bacterium]
MKPKSQDIIEELKSLKADFLLQDKSRSTNSIQHIESMDGFYNSLFQKIENIEINEPKTVSIHPLRMFLVKYKIVASFLLFFIASGMIYTLFSVNHTPTQPPSLEQLVSKTSSQYIMDYLYEEAMPTDEYFLWENIDNQNAQFTTLN